MKLTTIAYLSIAILACLVFGDHLVAHAARAFPTSAGMLVPLLVGTTVKKLEAIGLIP